MSDKLTLLRYGDTPFGVLGELSAEWLPETLYTVERRWLDNEPNVSCVPAGVYQCERYDSPTHGDTFILWNHDLDVGKFPGEANRFAILLHVANHIDNLQGCIGPGMSAGAFRVTAGTGVRQVGWGVGNSGDAMSLLLDKAPEEGFELEIVWNIAE